MRTLSLILPILLLAPGAWAFDDVENRPPSAPAGKASAATMKGQAEAARKILTTWQNEDPVPSARRLQVVYWTPADREPASGYRQRLSLIMDHIQGFYRSEMERHGFGPLVFPLEKDEKGLLKIHLVKGRKPFAHYDKKSGSAIRQECLPVLRKAGLQPNHETLLIFCNLANWDEEQKTFSHKSPYYAGGSHRGGNAWQLDSPELSIPNLKATEPLILDQQYGQISLGKHNSIFIGGIAHELGHALSLPHNREAPSLRQNGHRALMGDGNRTYANHLRNEGPGAHLEFASALKLASHPLFSRSQKALQVHAHIEYSDLAVTSDEKSFTFSGRISSNIPVYGLIAYLDPEGGGDYDAHTAIAIPDAEGRFHLECRHLVPGKRAELRILSCHANGATCQKSYHYSVKADGTPEVSVLQTHFALAPLVSALNSRDHSQLQAGFDYLHTKLGPGPDLDRINRVAKRLVEGVTNKRQTSTEKIAAHQKHLPLSDLTPAEQRVGWGEPTYDYLPNSDLLITSGGALYPHGIYAHAPALHRYDLKKGWKRLTGTCGLAENRNGSCVFIIKVDGREAYRSPVVRAGETHSFTVKVEGASNLELVTHDAGDSKSHDWAVWLVPTLHR